MRPCEDPGLGGGLPGLRHGNLARARLSRADGARMLQYVELLGLPAARS